MNESQTENRQTHQAPPLHIDNDTTGSAKRSRRNIIIIVVSLFVALCSCVGLCLVAGGGGAASGVIKAMQEKDDVEVVIDEFMRAMVNEDAEEAYGLFSTRSKRTTSLSDLEMLLQGNNFALFDGYQNVQVVNINIKAAFNTNPNMPQGTIAEVSGAVTYDGGFTGRFTSVLEEENGEWKLFNINVTIPPDKIGEQ